MRKELLLLVLAILLVLGTVVSSHANGFFVATAKNLRGALYLGAGPTPAHATELALVKCSQDSMVPCTCRVVCVRMECPPAVCAPPPMPMRPPVRKSKVSGYQPAPYPISRPMMQ